jgi:hypothetical protein
MLHPRFVVAVVLVCLAAPPASAAVSTARLRPQSPRVTSWLARGLEKSSTMRALVDRIERGDVVVYVELQHRLSPGVSACVTWMAATPGSQHRYVRVSLQPTLRRSDAIAMLAHELQHVVEVIDHPDVQSRDDLLGLYRRIGHRSGPTGEQWDTMAALRAGDSARLEVVSGA